MYRKPMTAKSKKPGQETTPSESIPFRWRYIILPVAIFLLSVILAAYFYHLLPAEAAYHFQDGTPDKWMSRGAIIAWMLTPQLLFALLSVAIVWGIIRLSARFQQTASSWVEKILSLMGNIVALPQIILAFAMLDIFSYNAYQIHLMPLWVFAVIVMGLGGIALGIFFVLAFQRALGVERVSKSVKVSRSNDNG